MDARPRLGDVRFAKQLEFLQTLPDEELDAFGGRALIEGIFRRAAEATCDFYIANTPTDGIPYWDTGAPGLAPTGRLAASVGPLQYSRGRWTRPRPSARKVCCG